MLWRIFNIKSPYFLIISSMIIVGVLNLASDMPVRFLASRIIEFTAPMIFFVFVLRRCEKPSMIMKGALLVALINLPLVLYEAVMLPDWGVTTDWWRGARVYGNLFWPNSFSVFLLPVTMIAYVNLRERMTKTNVIVLLALAAANILTFSRAGILALFIAGIVYEFMYRSGFRITAKKVWLVLLLAGTIAAYFIGAAYLEKHLTPGSISERSTIWADIIPYVQDHPIIGNGIGSYEKYRYEIYKGLSPHNFYLELMFELGAIGVALLLAFLCIIIFDMYRKAREKGKYRAGELGLAIMIGIMLVGVVGEAGFSQAVSLNAWVIAACCLIYRNKEDSDHTKEEN